MHSAKLPAAEPASPGRGRTAPPGGTERKRGWGHKFRAWWQARLPLTDTWQLGQRNVYILPTRAGLMFALTMLVMLLASINYQLNLGYLLTFLLAGSALVGMHMGHANLRGLRLPILQD